jgi:hypothetical protein
MIGRLLSNISLMEKDVDRNIALLFEKLIELITDGSEIK